MFPPHLCSRFLKKFVLFLNWCQIKCFQNETKTDFNFQQEQILTQYNLLDLQKKLYNNSDFSASTHPP